MYCTTVYFFETISNMNLPFGTLLLFVNTMICFLQRPQYGFTKLGKQAEVFKDSDGFSCLLDSWFHDWFTIIIYVFVLVLVRIFLLTANNFSKNFSIAQFSMCIADIMVKIDIFIQRDVSDDLLTKYFLKIQ